MGNIIHKARILETRIKVKIENRRQIKQQQYRRFLQNPSRHLPSYKKLRRLRNMLFYMGVVCMCIPCFQTVFFYHTIWDRPEPLNNYEEITLDQVLTAFLNVIPTVFGFLFCMFCGFSAVFDWVIYRRWGSTRSFIDW